MVAPKTPCPVNVVELLHQANYGLLAHTQGRPRKDNPLTSPCLRLAWDLGWHIADALSHCHDDDIPFGKPDKN